MAVKEMALIDWAPCTRPRWGVARPANVDYSLRGCTADRFAIPSYFPARTRSFRCLSVDDSAIRAVDPVAWSVSPRPRRHYTSPPPPSPHPSRTPAPRSGAGARPRRSGAHPHVQVRAVVLPVFVPGRHPSRAAWRRRAGGTRELLTPAMCAEDDDRLRR
ncbi:hypothetical protein B0H12DRAFT_298958 [Mycena haematopus]|nr:hypothetical protein B0H12DRAFT_298958 [Mycena haematopus]